MLTRHDSVARWVCLSLLLTACATQQISEPTSETASSSALLMENDGSIKGPDPTIPFMQEAKFLMEQDYRISVELQNSLRYENHPELQRLQAFVEQTSNAIDSVDVFLKTAQDRHLTDAETKEYLRIRNAWADESETLAGIFKTDNTD